MTDIGNISTQDIAAWLSEATDDQLQTVVQYINKEYKYRRTVKTQKLRRSLQVSDHVRFIGGKPQYLRGATGMIAEIRQTKALVMLDDGAIGKFRNGQVLCPLTLLEKLS